MHKIHQTHNQKCLDTNNECESRFSADRIDTHRYRATQSCHSVIFNMPMRSFLAKMNREPININNKDAQYEAIETQQDKYVKNNDPCKDSLSSLVVYTVAV